MSNQQKAQKYNMKSHKRYLSTTLIFVLESGSDLEIFISRSKLCCAELPEEHSLQIYLLEFQTTHP